MVEIALIAAFAAFIAQHLGLTDELAAIAVKVASCPKCCVMWITLFTLVLMGYDALASIALSLLLAYLSFWFGFVFIVLQKLYDAVWEKINKTKRRIK